jgi:hypothetical protein
MDILYNGAQRNESIVTFSEVPNILSVKQDVSGTKGRLSLIVYSGWSVSADTQYYFTLFGETISNVLAPQDAKNKKFYVSTNIASTAMSIARALRSCGSIAADYIITTGTTNTNGDTVIITAKVIGRKSFSNNIDKNIPTSYMLVAIGDDGSADEGNGDYFNSKIDVEVYQQDNYITTLEKNYYGDECSFDVTPVLATLTEPMKENEPILPYTLKVNKLAYNGTYTSLGEVSGYTTYGYLANQSEKYLPTNCMILSNNKVYDRGGLNYTMDRTVHYSVLAGSPIASRFGVKTSIYDSAMNLIESGWTYVNVPTSNPSIADLKYSIPVNRWYTNAAYLDIQVSSVDSNRIRFQIIRPLSAAEGWQRIFWRNEYGGISFFDFTSTSSESDSIDVETYEKNIFDYYDYDTDSGDTFERKKIYNTKIGKSVKVKSHLMEKKGKYIFNSLARSKKIWTYINGNCHYIIPKALEVAEDQTYNDIYTATFTYEYSDLS